jgi:hypothetical protein
VTAWRNRDAIVIHLVNLNNPMTMKGPFREFIPIGEQKVVVRIPALLRAKKTQLLVSQRVPQVERNGATLSITVPSILDHEVIAIDLQFAISTATS